MSQRTEPIVYLASFGTMGVAEWGINEYAAATAAFVTVLTFIFNRLDAYRNRKREK